jgi:hypothetical protein
LQTPIGAVYATNITPDNDTGIGNWSYDDFVRLMRRGIHKKGYTVYPAMPYPSFSRMRDDDLRALYAYLLHGVAPVRQPNRAPDIIWPLSMRWPLTARRWLFATNAAAIPAASGSRCAHCAGRVYGRSARQLRRLPHPAQFHHAGEGALWQRRRGLSFRGQRR